MAEPRFRTLLDVIAAESPVRLRTAREHARSIEKPPTETLEIVVAMNERVHGREAQVRRGFVSRFGFDEDKVPPLAVILRGGRGGAIRLKLYLSLLWIAAGFPHSVTASAQAWAVLLGLSDPETKGARSVRSGWKWLATNGLVLTKELPGVGSEVTLLSDLGDREDYSLPGKEMSAAKREGETNRKDFYVRIPHTFWTEGWIHALSGPAIGMLLVLLDVRGGQGPEEGLWFSGQVAADRYALSEETRGKGLAELRAFGVIEVEVRRIKSQTLASPRSRNVYRIRDERLAESPIR
jgi:hypothetical protein